jgi:hypothetical protein
MEVRMTGAVRLAVIALVLAAPAAAQEFQPPQGGRGESGGARLKIDLLGFSTRAGIDLRSGGSLVLGSTVDIAQLWSPSVRLRPSFEFSGGGSTTAEHVAMEVVYRFQPDQAEAIPYVGMGLGYFHVESGGTKTWPTVVMGFELRFRPSFNWLLEYHALDRLDRHRFLVGLATRGGGR